MFRRLKVLLKQDIMYLCMHVEPFFSYASSPINLYPYYGKEVLPCLNIVLPVNTGIIIVMITAQKPRAAHPAAVRSSRAAAPRPAGAKSVQTRCSLSSSAY